MLRSSKQVRLEKVNAPRLDHSITIKVSKDGKNKFRQRANAAGLTESDLGRFLLLEHERDQLLLETWRMAYLLCRHAKMTDEEIKERVMKHA